MENTFLKLYDDYWYLDLTTYEIIILSKIKQFAENNKQCRMTNKQFADMFKCTERTIERSLKTLSDNNFIRRDTSQIKDENNLFKKRTLYINDDVIEQHILKSKHDDTLQDIGDNVNQTYDIKDSNNQSLNNNDEGECSMGQITRKCGHCGNEIVIDTANIKGIIKFKSKFYHRNCFELIVNKRLKSSNKNTKETWTEVFNNIQTIEDETTAMLKDSVMKDELNAYLIDKYNIVSVPKRFWTTLAELSNGVYKNKKCRPVSINTVYDCWCWIQHKLDEINSFNQQNNKGPSDDNGRLIYDFAIVINKIPEYMKNKSKEENDIDKYNREADEYFANMY